MKRLPISACIIAGNEAGNIAECIDSVAFCAETVVVDSLSTDGTADLARARGCRVIEQAFLGHVRQKQLAVDSASHDWVLCVDADERVDPSLRAAIERCLAVPDPAIAGYEVNRHSRYLGRFIDHGGWFPEWRLRLFDRRRGRWAGVDPHDRVEVDGPTRRLDGELLHFNYRSIEHHVAKIDRYTSIMVRERVAAGERASLAKLVLRPPARFLRMYVARQGFRDGTRGLIVATMGAFYVFLKYAKLWEARHAPPPGERR